MSLIAATAAFALLAAGPAAVNPPGVDAGARDAATRCASCHAIGGQGRSRNSSAPPFRDIRLRYNALSLERKLGNISTHGHYDMRPLSIQASEAADLAAYIESLK